MEAGAKRDRKDALNRLVGLVEELGNVSEACRRLGLDRSAYYRILRATRSAEAGAFPPRRRNAVPEGLEPALLKLCLEYPEWGCDRLAHYLTLTGSPVSSPTAQKILIRNGLGKVADRMAEKGRREGGGRSGTGPVPS
jgi:hypothetical protein